MKNISQLLFIILLITTINSYAGFYDFNDCGHYGYYNANYGEIESLKVAISRGYLADVKTILDRGNIDITQPSDYSSPPLFQAAFVGCSKVVQELITRGANIHDRDPERRTPLHYAAAQCHLDAAICLLQAGANPQATDYCGKTPAALALKNEHHKGNRHIEVANVIDTWQSDLPEYKEPEQEA